MARWMALAAGRATVCRHLISGRSGVVHHGTWRLASQAIPWSRRRVKLEDGMTVSQLAKELRTSPSLVNKTLRDAAGERVKGWNKALPLELCELVVLKMGHTPILPDVKEVARQPRDPMVMVPRPPIVTVMGHVDHGKTTLLDSLRKTSVAANEAGGITQHIGAFSVLLGSGHRITFLDTPGHAAFTAMRARGATVTDIVVLVVAADDGVMEQTRECINLVQQARVPMVVAINKCDKHGVDVSKVKHQLLQHGVQLEEFGGDVQAVEVSALKGSGMSALEEALLVQAELCDIRGDLGGPVEGVVIESRVDRGLGPVATVIVLHGTLRVGDVLVGGKVWARVRLLLGEGRQVLKEASPSTPVLTVGWKEVPTAGDECIQVDSEQYARQVASHRAVLAHRGPVVVPEVGDVVPLVVKGDVVGSVEALEGVLSSRQPQQIGVSMVHSGVGPVSESDVDMAASAKGVILAFNVSYNKATASLARARGVTILSHNVIYKLMELLKEELQSYLPSVWEEEVIGEAVVLKVFRLSGSRAAAVGGCRVKQGKLLRNAMYRLVRDGEVVHEGQLTGMKHGKEDLEMARKETECGISFSSDPGFEEGDRVLCFSKKKVQQKLEWNLGF